LVVVTGILSAGKTTACRELVRRSEFRYFDGDAFLKTHPPTPVEQLPVNFPKYTQRTLESMLAELDNLLDSEDVVLDMILPADYVGRIQQRFPGRVMAVLLRVDPAQQLDREAARGKAGDLHREMIARTDLSGPDSLYDLVIDTTRSTPVACAEQILAKAEASG